MGLKPAVVARDAGLKPDYIRDLLRGSKKSISAESAARLAKLLECNLGWLLTGEVAHIESNEVATTLGGSVKRENNGATSLQNYSSVIPDAVPEIDARAGAGDGSIGDNEVVSIGKAGAYVGHRVTAEWVFPQAFLRHELRTQPGEIMILEVVGDSMSPTLESGDRLIIDTAHSRPVPDGLYIIDEGHGPMVKRLQLIRRSSPPEIKIISDNSRHETYTLPLDEIRIIGRVSGRVTKM